ncbi:MAG: hypothetical protein DU430_09160 [Candidatus Tokpelaia sp.]|nr:MAG: hypothetical protein DU430_09160 [Candidatus Tokpelaia sp.]
MAYDFITDKGIIVSDTSNILGEVQEEFKSALGNEISVAANTPQGVLINAETISRVSIQDILAEMANKINPNYSGGIFLDTISSLMGLQRREGQRGILENVKMSGIAGTIIPIGSRASIGESGNEFSLLQSVRLGEDGTAIGSFQAINDGKIIVPIGALNTIISNILGWDEVSNLMEEEIGQDEESDEELRWRRRLTLGLQGIATIPAMYSGIYDTQGVRDCNIIENYTKNDRTIEGVLVEANTLAIYIDGGDGDILAKEILKRHNPGCGLQGDIEISVEEEVSGKDYLIRFSRPEYINIFCRIKIKNSEYLPNGETSAREAIVSYSIGGQTGERGLSIGKSVSTFELASAVNRDYPRVFTSDCEVSLDGETWTRESISCNGNQKFIITTGDIEVIVL